MPTQLGGGSEKGPADTAPGGNAPSPSADAKSSARSAWKALGAAADVGGGGGGAGGFLMPGMREMTKGKGGELEGIAGAKEHVPELSPGDLTPRTEFVILFVWQEPISGETTADSGDKKN